MGGRGAGLIKPNAGLKSGRHNPYIELGRTGDGTMWQHSDWMINGHQWMWGWFMPFGGFWFVILLVVLFAVLLLRSPHRHAPPAARSAALDVLEQRYARGEIEREEYLQKKADLGGG